MRKYLALALVCLAACFASATSTVTGNVKNLTSSPVGSGAIVRFELKQCVGFPRVATPGILAPLVTDVVPDPTSGAFSATLYENSEITCANGVNTYYHISVLLNNVAQYSDNFLINSTPFDLTSLSSAPMHAPPNGPPAYQAIWANPTTSQTITQPTNHGLTITGSGTTAALTVNGGIAVDTITSTIVNANSLNINGSPIGFTNLAGQLALTQIPTGGSATTFLRGDGTWGTVNFTNLAGQLAFSQIPTGGSSSNYLRGDGSWATPIAVAQWGTIIGTLSTQSDLQSALNLKANLAGATFSGAVTVPTLDATTVVGSVITASNSLQISNSTGQISFYSIGTSSYDTFLSRDNAGQVLVTDGNGNGGFEGKNFWSWGTFLLSGDGGDTYTAGLSWGGSNQVNLGNGTAGDASGTLKLNQLCFGSSCRTSWPTGTTWGAITGTLSSQTDLQTALNAKLASSSFTYSGVVALFASGSCSGYLKNDGTCSTPTAAAWGNITGTLSSQTDLQSALNLKANLASPTFTGTVTTAGITVNGNWLLPAMATASSGSGNFNSNAITMQGSYWGGSAPQADQWQINDTVGTGTTPTSVLYFNHSGSTGNAAVVVPMLQLGGVPADTGLSRYAGGTVVVGNGAQGSYSGTIIATNAQFSQITPAVSNLSILLEQGVLSWSASGGSDTGLSRVSGGNAVAVGAGTAGDNGGSIYLSKEYNSGGLWLYNGTTAYDTVISRGGAAATVAIGIGWGDYSGTLKATQYCLGASNCISSWPTGAVTSITGDGNVFSNSASTGAVTLTPVTQTANYIYAGPASNTGPALSIVQKGYNATYGSNVTTTLTNAVTAGHLLVLLTYDVSGVTDSAGNSWTLAGKQNYGTYSEAEIWYTCNAKGAAAGSTFSATGGVNGNGMGMGVVEVQGNPTSSCLDAYGGGNGQNANWDAGTTGSVTNSQEIVFADYAWYNYASGGQPTWNNWEGASGWTLEGYGGVNGSFPNSGGWFAYNTVTGLSGSYGINMTITGYSSAYVATFKLSSVTTPPPNFRAMVAADLPGGTTGTPGTAVVLATSPTLTTPTLGVATATSINKLAITAPSTSATLTIANSKTLTVNNNITLAGTDGSTLTIPGSILTRTCEVHIWGSGSSSVLQNTDGEVTSCYNGYGTTETITAVRCWANAGSPTVQPQLTGGSATSILTGALTCSTSTTAPVGAAGTLNGSPTLTSGSTIDDNIVTAGGVATNLRIFITLTRTQ